MRHRLLLAACAAFLLAGCLAFEAFVSPEAAFLRPGFQGGWIAHPDPPLDFHRRPGTLPCPPMIFRHRFAAEPGSRLLVAVTALRGFTLRINGIRLPADPPSSWKRSTSFDLSPYLHPGSENLLSLRVENPAGPPAVLVEGPASVRSGAGWTVITGSDGDTERPAVPALSGEQYLANDPNPLRRSPLFPFALAALALLLGFVVYAAVPRRLKPWLRNGKPPEPPEPPPAPSPRSQSFLRDHGFCLLLLLIVGLWQMHNAWTFTYSQGCDRRGHVGYIQRVAASWTAPRPGEGWESVQPPLYYYFAAAVYTLRGGTAREADALRGVVAASALVCLLLPFLAWIMLCRLFPDSQRARNLGLAVAALLPMPFHHGPVISNEGFSATVIGAAILCAVWLATRERITWLQAALLGVACAAAMLSKYTGVFAVAATVAALSLRPGKREAARAAALVIAITLALSGWYYVRNVMLFGRAFVLLKDLGPRYAYYQIPGYNDLSYFFRFGPVLFESPDRDVYSSFWDGLYATLWADAQSCGFLDQEAPRGVALEAVVLWLALVPSAAILLGFGEAVRRLIIRGFHDPYLVPVLTFVATVTGAVLYDLQLPMFSSVKAWYLWSLLVPAALFAALGLERMSRQLGRLRWLLYGHLAALGLVILYLDWYRTW